MDRSFEGFWDKNEFGTLDISIKSFTEVFMFGKKKEAPVPQPPFQLQVLTTEYLIEGTAQGDEQLYIPISDDFWSPFQLTDVRITSINDDKIPVHKADAFEVQGRVIVAVIPLKDVTTMKRFEVYKNYQKEMRGVYYVGPYLIEGTLKSFENDRFDSTLLMENVAIRHANPNSSFKEIRAPHILIYTNWLHGREVK
jgi:hypothetical protein